MIFFYYIIKQFFLSLPDLYSVVSNILGLVSPESYRVSYPVTIGNVPSLSIPRYIMQAIQIQIYITTSRYTLGCIPYLYVS